MQSSSDRKNKRNILEKGIGKEINNFELARTPENPVAYSSCCRVNASFEGKPKEFVEQEKHYVPDPEILDVAFNCSPTLSSQDIRGMSTFRNLKEYDILSDREEMHDRQRLLEEHLGVGVIHPHKDLDEMPFDSYKIRDW